MPRILVIECPPRHGKSEFLSKWFPAWYLGCYPENRLILTSYEANFAKQWGRKVRNILNEHGQRYFNLTLQQDNKSASEWTIAGHEGGMQTAGAGGALVGKGAHCLIIDDPVKNAEEAKSAARLTGLWDWWESTASTRLEPDGIAIFIAQRWRDEDPSGRLISAAATEDGDPITRIHLPAIAEENDPLGRKVGDALWPLRYPVAKLERMRASKSQYWWNALYQQRPTQHDGSEWPEEYFGDHILSEFWPDRFDMLTAYLDPSKGKTDRSDFSAIVACGLSGGKIWLDCDIKRRPVPKIVSDSFWFCHGRSVDAFGIESNSFQELLAPEFDRVCRELNVPPLPIHMIENTINKEVRINRLGPYLSRRQIVIRDNEGGRLLVKQLKEHPIGDHDDGPDAAEGAIRLMIRLMNAQVVNQDEYETAMV